MSKLYLLLVVLLSVVFFTPSCDALNIPLNQTEYDNIIPLLTQFGYNVTLLNQTNFCSYFLTKHEIRCNTSPLNSSIGVIIDISVTSKFNSQSAVTVTGSEFTLYQYVTKYTIEFAVTGSEFLSYISANSPSSGPSIACRRCTVNSIPEGLVVNRLEIGGSILNQVIPLSYLKNIYDFSCPSLDTASDVTYLDDMTANNTFLNYFESYASNIPNLSKFTALQNIKITTSNSFNSSTWSNIKTLRSSANQIQAANISAPQPFPVEAFELNNIKLININFTNTGNQSIQVSLTNPLSSFFMQGSLSFRNENNTLPFTPFPYLTGRVAIQNMGLAVFDISMFKNVSWLSIGSNPAMAGPLPQNISLDPTKDYIAFANEFKYYKLNIYGNKLNGTMPPWLCTIHSDFGGNKFTGDLPPCYSCFLQDPNIQSSVGTGNNFTNVVSGTGPSTCPTFNITSIGVYKIVTPKCTAYKLGINGTDLGVSSVITQTNNYGVAFSWVPHIQNQFYLASFDIYGTHKSFFNGNGTMKVTFTYLTYGVKNSFNLDFTPYMNKPIEIMNMFGRTEECGSPKPTDTPDPSPTPEPNSSNNNISTNSAFILYVVITIIVLII